MRSLMLYLSLLFITPIYAQTGFLKTSPKLAYWEVGKKKEVVLILHGGPCADHTYMRPEFDVLAKTAKVIYYDQRGCGESELSPTYYWEDHVKDIKRMIQKHAPGKKVFLAGSSWGSLLALLYAYQHPEDIKGMILSGLVGWKGQGGERPDNSFFQPDDPADLPKAVFQLYSMKEKMKVQKLAEDGQMVQELVPVEKKVAVYRGKMHAQPVMSMVNAPLLEDLSQIEVPVLIFNGTRPCVYYDSVEKYAEVLPNSEIIRVKGSCHDPWLSDPAQFFERSNRFIRKNKRRRKKR